MIAPGPRHGQRQQLVVTEVNARLDRSIELPPGPGRSAPASNPLQAALEV